MIVAASRTNLAASTTLAAAGYTAGPHQYHHRMRTLSNVSLSDDDAEIRQPTAKRAKVSSEVGASVAPKSKTSREIRLQQNREASRKSRLRKKLQEKELQNNVAIYTKSNATLKKQNFELQRMLDEARSKVASVLANNVASKQQHYQTQPSPVVPLSTSLYTYLDQELGHLPATTKAVDVPQATLSTTVSAPSLTNVPVPEVVVHENTSYDYDPLDLLLENDDWLNTDKQDVVQEAVVSEEDNNDGCADPISQLFDNETWFMAKDHAAEPVTTSNTVNTLPVLPTSSHPTQLSPSQNERVYVVSPVVSQPKASAITPAASIANIRFDGLVSSSLQGQQTSQSKPVASAASSTKEETRESRLEKNREAARKRRLKKKMEHEKLQQSVAFYTQSNEMLKKKNEELQLMILQARSKVAETTNGFQHYTTVFGGANNNHHHSHHGNVGTGNNVASTTAPVLPPTSPAVAMTASTGKECACAHDNEHGFPILPDYDDDDDHSLSFLWS